MFQVVEFLKAFLLLALSTFQSDGYKVKSISSKQFEWAHNPFWDVTSQTLYFADIKGGTISSYKPSSKALNTATVVTGSSHYCSVIIPFEKEKDKFVVTIRNTVTNLTWDSTSSSTGKPVLVAELGTNSSIHTLTGKADPMGRLWVGTVGPFSKKAQPEPHAGSEYMITGGGKVVTKISNVSVPDGLAWNSNKTKLYFVDSHEKKIERFDYDNESGDISNRKVIFDTKANKFHGVPTGMTEDTEGKLWIAQFFAGKVIRIDPDNGELLRTVDIPAKEVTNVVFGGKNLDVLYVTSARIFKEVSAPTKYSGRVFAITGLMNSGKPATGYPSQKITAI